MKKFLTICAFVAATLSLTGCAGVANTVSNKLTQTQVVLSDDNFKVIGHAYGEATATYIDGRWVPVRHNKKKNPTANTDSNTRTKASHGKRISYIIMLMENSCHSPTSDMAKFTA